MKIKLGKLKQIIKEALLVEAPCTSCGDPNAYVGFNSCECPNPKCRFFSQRQFDDGHDLGCPLGDTADAFDDAMVIQIPGDVAVSHDFFENDREELEAMYNVSIDSGPDGVVEVSGEHLDVICFTDSHGLTSDQYEEVEDEDEEAP